MKQTVLVSLALIAAAFLAPLLALGGETGVLPPAAESPAISSSPAPTASPEPTAEPTPPAASSMEIPFTPADYQSDEETTVRLLYGGQAADITLAALLQGIVPSEMPFGYPDEALKAQTVAARSFVLYLMEAGGKHDDADICGDPSCCLAYKPIAELAAAWGEAGYAQRIAALVADTDGLVLTYGGELCQTLFFAVSSGRTESAADVWGGDLPYLQSVASLWDAGSEKYAAQTALTAEEARQKLLAAWPGMALEGTPDTWLTAEQRSSAGGVLYMELGGVMVSGTDLRRVFGLASHIFTLRLSDGEVRFESYGHGHGVGMSQYGASQMAEAGSGFAEILGHYYTGAQLAYVTDAD